MSSGNAGEMIELFKNWPLEQFKVYREMIETRFEEFRSVAKAHGPLEFIKQFYLVFDAAVEMDRSIVSCSKGCHFCCHINVDVYSAEVLAIVEYCRNYRIVIPKLYLKELLKHGKKEVAKSSVAPCVFLKNGLCSIYPVRPVACRNYFVVSRPELCDSVSFPSDTGHRVAVKVKTIPMALAIACHGVLAEQGKVRRLPYLLLPHSK